MTDEARIARLTEIARRVWVDTSVTCVDGDVMAVDAATYDGEYIRIARHPRALDALEAALLVLAGDDTRLRLARLERDMIEILAAERARRDPDRR